MIAAAAIGMPRASAATSRNTAVRPPAADLVGGEGHQLVGDGASGSTSAKKVTALAAGRPTAARARRLVDPAGPAPRCATSSRGDRRGPRRQRLHPRPRGRGVRRGIRGVHRDEARHRVANGTDAITLAFGRSASVRATRSSCCSSPLRLAEPIRQPARARVLRRRPRDVLMTPRRSRACSPRHEGGIAVHLFGNVAPVREIADAGPAGARGRRAGRGDEVAADGPRPGRAGHDRHVQLHPFQTLGCLGDAGAITTDDDALAEAAACRASTARADKVTSSVGWNSRLDELQAGDPARAAAPPRHLADGHRAAAAHWDAGLGEHVACRSPCRRRRGAWHLFIVRTEDPTSWTSAERGRSRGCRATTARRSPPARSAVGCGRGRSCRYRGAPAPTSRSR